MFDMFIEEDNNLVSLQIKGMTKDVRVGVKNAFVIIGRELKKESKRYINSKDKTGRLYRITRFGRSYNHRASAPGQSPANISGNLIKNLFKKTGNDSTLTFGDRASYAGFLEKGTARMAKRPYLLKAIKAKRRDMISHFTHEINKHLYREVE